MRSLFPLFIFLLSASPAFAQLTLPTRSVGGDETHSGLATSGVESLERLPMQQEARVGVAPNNPGIQSESHVPMQEPRLAHRSIALYGGHVFETRSTVVLAGLTARFPLKTAFSNPRFEKLHLEPSLEMHHQSTPYSSQVAFVRADLNWILTTTFLSGFWTGAGLTYMRLIGKGGADDFGRNAIGFNLLVGSPLVTISSASLFAQLRFTYIGIGASIALQSGLRFKLD